MFASAKVNISLGYNLARCVFVDWDKNNRIAQGLFLGVLPIKKNRFGSIFENTPEQIIDFINASNPTRPLMLVVSVVQKKELKDQAFFGVSPAEPEDWERLGIAHLLFEIPDFEADCDIQKGNETLDRMNHVIEMLHGAVLIHCKAGRSRSGMMSGAYFASFLINPATGKHYELKEAIKTIGSVRHQLSVDAPKEKKGEEIIAAQRALHPHGEEKKAEPTELVHRLNRLLSLHTTKNDMVKLDAVAQLRKYKNEFANSTRADHLKIYIQLIYKAHSEQWFYILFSTLSPLNDFIKCQPNLGSPEKNSLDLARRKSLTVNLINEYMAYLCKKLDCTRAEIEKLITEPNLEKCFALQKEPPKESHLPTASPV